MALPKIPRDQVKRAENENFPLLSLAALRELRRSIDELEAAAILKAREMGASTTDIGEALGMTRQAAYYRLRHIRPQADSATSDEVVIIPEAEPSDPQL